MTKVQKRYAVLAVFLTLALLIGACTQIAYFMKTRPLTPQMQAIYPTMAQFPLTVYGTPAYDTAEYAAWEAAVKQRTAYYGAGENLAAFFAKLYPTYLAGGNGENRVISPLNIYMALAVLAEVSDGDTRAQILTLLGASDLQALRNQAYAVWNANYRDDGRVTSILASSVWLDKDLAYNEDTVSRLAQLYYASSFTGEMGSEAFNNTLRDWLNRETGGRLADQIQDLAFDSETAFALATTLYFRARFANEFTETEATFHGASGEKNQTFLTQTQLMGTLYRGAQFSAVGVPLAESGTLWLMLPDASVTADMLLADTSLYNFLAADKTAWKNKANYRLHISLPKFDVAGDVDLIDGLQSLGITKAFSGEADFTPLLPHVQTHLDSAKHGARVTLDKDGITATAYTLMMNATSAPPMAREDYHFTCDRPFLFVVTGADALPLFCGVVNNP